MSADTQELAQIPFNKIIGDPLIAVVDAQARSSMATLAFLGNPMIRNKDGSLRNADFKYTKHSERDGKPVEQDCSLSVPVLTLVPIPFLRIAEVNISFRAKLTSTQTWSSETNDESSQTEDKEMEGSKGGGILGFFGGSKEQTKTTIHGSFSHTQKTMAGASHTSQFTLDIKVRAVQDILPAGMERVLTMLENCIKETAKDSGAGGGR